MEFEKINITVNSELKATTALAEYRLRVTQQNGRTAAVSATVRTTSAPSASGTVSYRSGTYAVGYFPYDADTLSAVMDDFKGVVEAIKAEDDPAAQATDETATEQPATDETAQPAGEGAA